MPGAGLLLEPLEMLGGRVVRETGGALLQRLVPELGQRMATKGVKNLSKLSTTPKVTWPNYTTWGKTVSNLSDETAGNLTKFIDDGGEDTLSTVKQLIDQDAGGNSEPLWKWTTSKDVHPDVPQTTGTLTPTVTRSSTDIKADLDEWQDLAAVRLDSVPMSTVKTPKGDIQGKVYPGTPEELL